MSNQKNDNKKEDKNKDMIIFPQKNIKSDFIYFKEEILKEVSQFEKNFSKQNQEIKDNLKEKIILYDSSIDKLKSQLKELSDLVANNKYLKEHVDKLSDFKNEVLDLRGSNQIKLNIFEKETQNNIFRINNIINNSILYPGIIGNNSKFKTFHEYIDFTLTELSTTKSFRNGIEFDFKSFKAKIDKALSSLKLKIETSFNSANQLVKRGLLENENKIKDFIQGKLFDVEVKNKELESKIEKSIDELNTGINNMNNKSNEIFKKLDEEISKFKLEKNMIYKSIDECNNNYNEIKNNINNLENLIKSQNKDNNMELEVEKIKKEIINMDRDIIEKKLNLENNKNIKTDFIETSALESKSPLKINIIEKKTEPNNKNENKNISPILKKRRLSNNNGILEKKFDDKVIENKTKLLKLGKNKKIKNNSFVKNINNKEEAQIIKSQEMNIDEIDSKNLLLSDKELNNKQISTNKFKEDKNVNQKKKKRSFSYGKKKNEIKDPLKTILKLKIDLQDIDADFYSNANIDTQSKFKNKFQINDKDVENKIPLTSRENFVKEKNKINVLYKKDLIEHQNTIDFKNKKIKDALKIKSATLKYFKKTNSINKKEKNNYNLYKENSYRIKNFGKPLSPTTRNLNKEKNIDSPLNFNTFHKSNKNLNLFLNKEQS